MTRLLVEPLAGTHHVAAAAADRRLDPADLEAAVAAGAVARRGAYPATDTEVAEVVAETLAAVRSLDQLDAGGPVDWSRFGHVLPVLSGSPGAGASTVAVAMVDALQLGGRCTMLVDAADPARSGLGMAVRGDGGWRATVSPLLQIRYAWRHDALLARLQSRLPVISPGMVPPPRSWRPDVDPLHVTVVDVGHDGWRATANPLLGAGSWLRCGRPASYPLLVVRPSRPSLRQAEQVLARIEPWTRARALAVPCQLVVVGAKRWPRGVPESAGRLLQPLLGSALFVPHDGLLAAEGITAELLAPRVRRPLEELLTRWGLLGATVGAGPVAPLDKGAA